MKARAAAYHVQLLVSLKLSWTLPLMQWVLLLPLLQTGCAYNQRQRFDVSTVAPTKLVHNFANILEECWGCSFFFRFAFF